MSRLDEYLTKCKELDAARGRGDESAEDDLTHALEHLWRLLTDEEQEIVNRDRG